MSVIESRSTHAFVVQDPMPPKQEVVHIQKMIPYPVAEKGKQLSTAVEDQAPYLESTYHLVHEITRVKRNDGKYFVRIRWSGSVGTMTKPRELLGQIEKEVPGTAWRLSLHGGRPQFESRNSRLKLLNYENNIC